MSKPAAKRAASSKRKLSDSEQSAESETQQYLRAFGDNAADPRIDLTATPQPAIKKKAQKKAKAKVKTHPIQNHICCVFLR